MPHKTWGEQKEEWKSGSTMWSHCPIVPCSLDSALTQLGCHSYQWISVRSVFICMPNRESSCKMEINRRFLFLNINVNAKEGNKFSIFSCKEHENDPGESFQGSRRNIVVIMPLVNILHIHPFCFVHGNVLMNLLVCFWMKLSLPLSFSVSLSFLWIHTESNSSLPKCNYGNFWRFVGSSETAVCHSTKDLIVSAERSKNFHINTGAYWCFWQFSIF